jgi:hypothetical protein
MQYKSTVVTFFFDLSKLEDYVPNNRSIDFYIKNGRNTLMIDRPMVIFCDPSHKKNIEEIRNECCPNIPTVYIEQNLQEYEHYKLNWPLLDKNHVYSNSRVNRSYFLTMTFKYVALLIAAKRNDFSTSHYTWIDFGCSHVAPKNFVESARLLLDNPRPRIGVCYIRYRNHKDLIDSSSFCKRGQCGIAGGIISVEREYMFKLYPRYMRIFYEHVEKQIWYSDEQIMTYVHDRHADLFDVYYGDYKSLLTNYIAIKDDWHHIRWFFINEAVKAGDYQSAKQTLNKLLESVKTGLVTDISDADKAGLFSLSEEINNCAK